MTVEGDHLTLEHRRGVGEEHDLASEASRWWTAIAQLPRTVHWLTEGPWDGGVRLLAVDARAHLEALLVRIDAADAAVGQAGFDQDVAARQHALLRATRELVSSCCLTGRLPLASWEAYRETVAPLVAANDSDVAREHLRVLHAHVVAWRERLSPAEWAAVTVTVVGAPGAGAEHLAVRYFETALGDSALGDSALGKTARASRIVYREDWSAPDGTALDSRASVAASRLAAGARDALAPGAGDPSPAGLDGFAFHLVALDPPLR